ncbi:hypothetical protein E2C01_055454 [Portunus trituberculatus]|uniref:Uncharacterized protein n=1 Tax=Portunus trituberculatus TaxID=210409 RepID=A0A5B7GR80_PORTR|nr:hypothetical protein [Portunus trituberculatus]
MTAVTLPC